MLSLGLVRVGVAMKPMFDRVEQARPTRNNICPEHHIQVKQSWMCHHDVKNPHKVEAPLKAVNLGTAKNPQFVLTDDGEWKSLEEGNDHTIQLSAWVDVLDPIFVQGTYYIWPDSPTEAVGFQLIQEPLKKKGGYLMGTTNTDGTSKVLALTYHTGLGCVIGVMCAHEQYLRVVPAQKINTAMEALPAPNKQHLKLATQILDGLPHSFNLEAIPDSLGQKQWEYVHLKTEGTATISPPTAGLSTPDLMEALRATKAEVEKKKTPSKSSRRRAKA